MPSEEQTLSEPEKRHTADEVAQRFRMTVKKVHAEVRAGRLGCLQISPRFRLFLERHLQEYEALIERPGPGAMLPQTQRQPIPRDASEEILRKVVRLQ
jgi:hypothetical protein